MSYPRGQRRTTKPEHKASYYRPETEGTESYYCLCLPQGISTGLAILLFIHEGGFALKRRKVGTSALCVHTAQGEDEFTAQEGWPGVR